MTVESYEKAVSIQNELDQIRKVHTLITQSGSFLITTPSNKSIQVSNNEFSKLVRKSIMEVCELRQMQLEEEFSKL